MGQACQAWPTGACSMVTGEYVSVSSQNELVAAACAAGITYLIGILVGSVAG